MGSLSGSTLLVIKVLFPQLLKANDLDVIRVTLPEG